MNVLARCLVALLLAAGLHAPAASGHALSPALLEINEAGGGAYLVRLKQTRRDVMQQALQPEFPPHCRVVEAPREAFTDAYREVTFRVHCDAPGLAGQRLAVPGLAGNNSALVFTARLANGARHTQVLNAGNPAVAFPDAGDSGRVFGDYFTLGATHLLTGLDHLLFLAALVMLVQRLRPLALVITAFTAGHALSVVLSTLGLLSVPSFLVEIFIALSIVALSLDVFFRDDLQRSTGYTAALCAAFGVLHGMGFASALEIADLGRLDKAVALLAFNLGIEAVQLVVVTLAASCLYLLLRVWPSQRLALLRVAACVLGSTGSLWFWERLLASASAFSAA